MLLLRRSLLLLALLASVCACARRDAGTPLTDWQSDGTPGDAQHDFWYRNTMPAATPNGSSLVMRAYIRAFDVVLGTRTIYRFARSGPSHRLTLHVIPLPDGAGGQPVAIRVPAGTRLPFFGDDPRLVAGGNAQLALADIAAAPLRSGAVTMVLAFTFVIVGLLTLAIAILRRHGAVIAVLAFGLFTGIYGLRLLTETYLPLLLGFDRDTLESVKWLLTYVIPVPGWLLAQRILGDGWRNSMRWQVRLFAAFAVIASISDVVTRRAGSMEVANDVLVLVGAVNILVNLVRLRRSRSAEVRALLVASAFFIALTVNDNLISLGVLPWQLRLEKLGFAVFVATLGWATVRAFVGSERQLLAIEAELRTARDIQQSLLPRSMPANDTLRFDARYDPASSVAGDLYDFVVVDEHRLGVFVADVSGHGVPAALVASMVKVAFTSVARHAGEPAVLMAELNDILRRDIRKAFVTATYLFFDASQRMVDVCNAGHPAPLLWRASSGELHELGAANVLLGRFANARYTSAAHALAPGDRIVAFTDGVTEARNGRDEQFGEARLHALARESASAIAEAVRTWRDGRNDDVDDVTVVSIQLV